MRANLRLATTFSIAVYVAAASPGLPAGGGGGATEGYVPQFTLEDMGERGLVKITLTEAAVRRLGIETAVVTAQEADRKFTVSGRIEIRGAEKDVADLNAVPVAPVATAFVKVDLQEDLEYAADKPIEVRKVRGSHTESIAAQPDLESNKGINAHTGGHLLFQLPSDAPDFQDGEIVVVEIPYARNGEVLPTIPYSALIYDAVGDEWAYINPTGNVFLRHEIDIAYIKDDVAFLNEAPEMGMRVVTVGAAELLGTEYRIGH